MQQPTSQIKKEVHEEENNYERYALDEQRRGAPLCAEERGQFFIIRDSDHESGEQACDREKLPEKPSKEPPQTEQREHAEKNQIHPVHTEPLARMMCCARWREAESSSGRRLPG